MSTVKVDTWKSSDGTRTYEPCSAWVNFDGSGTVSIRDSENVSSITDNGTGDWTINFTISMDNANYSVSSSSTGTGPLFVDPGLTVASFTTGAVNAAGTIQDVAQASLQIFGGIT